MTLLPIVARELRVASRRASTYWLRCGTALGVISMGAWLLLTMWRQSPQELAKVMFVLLGGCVMLFSLLSGVRYTSDCLSIEKREGTLGLLFLTDLKGYDVILGKLAATSLSALYAAMAVVPILAVPLLLGGITLGEVARVSLVTLNTLFLSLSLGLCASACCKSAKTAAGVAFSALLLLAAGGPGLGLLLNVLNKPPQLTMVASCPSPGFGFTLAFEPNFVGRASWYWASLAVDHVIAWLGLALASVVLPFTWQDRSASKPSWKERIRLWFLGNSEERAQHRGTLLDVNPFFWLASRVPSKLATPWLMLLAMAVAWFGFYLKFRGDWLNEGVYITTGIILGLTFKAWVASEATRQMAEERQGGTLELLLCTPLRIEEILRGQWLALRRQFLWPVCAVLFVLLVLMQASLRPMMSPDQRTTFATIWLGAMVMFVADLVTLYWVGMWDGLTTANAQRATGNSLGKVLIVPWGAMALLVIGISLNAARGGPQPEGMFMFYAWLSFGLVTNLIYTAWSRTRLLTEFRAVAAQKYAPPLNTWQRIGRFLGRAVAQRSAPARALAPHKRQGASR